MIRLIYACVVIVTLSHIQLILTQDAEPAEPKAEPDNQNKPANQNEHTHENEHARSLKDLENAVEQHLKDIGEAVRNFIQNQPEVVKLTSSLDKARANIDEAFYKWLHASDATNGTKTQEAS
ncbi:hypothetical protein ILUMI_15844 [Ignelater luminosus]|uniref:Secreted protein n=1 Tax=Ignelater luminosus TaxID=2038154 RepID=A0A8K0CTD2_IGNLU|nr:hypothetical protein ILUMI_15844 [Ignelater luminosus]